MRRDWQKLVIESKDLPLGHYAKIEAEIAVNEEYFLARQAAKQIKNQNVTESAAKICAKITTTLNLPKIRRLSLNENIWPAGADYSRRVIRFNGDQIYLKTLLHELAHHVQHSERGFGYGHGPGFVEAFNLVVEAWKE